jgi:hypothetical protein
VVLDLSDNSRLGHRHPAGCQRRDGGEGALREDPGRLTATRVSRGWVRGLGAEMLSTPRAALVPLGSGTVAARHDWPVPKHINAPYTAGPGRPSRRRELGRTARLAPRAVAWQCPHRINLDYHGPFQDGACLRSDLVRAPVDIPTSGSSGVATDGLIGGGHTHGCRQNALDSAAFGPRLPVSSKPARRPPGHRARPACHMRWSAYGKWQGKGRRRSGKEGTSRGSSRIGLGTFNHHRSMITCWHEPVSGKLYDESYRLTLPFWQHVLLGDCRPSLAFPSRMRNRT